ncbi:MAG: DUF333 domain-containing protein [Labilithrix sp.]|nr:DUF333 domain-containing protein [Labilithrix sp.]
MKNVYLAGLGVLLSMSVACAAETDPGASNARAGLANPSSVYCADLGYTAEPESCTFPDGTSCELWSFYRGACGQQHSFCNRHGGQVSAKSEDIGDGFTTTFALCTLPSGATCKEQDFAATGRCDSPAALSPSSAPLEARSAVDVLTSDPQ